MDAVGVVSARCPHAIVVEEGRANDVPRAGRLVVTVQIRMAYESAAPGLLRVLRMAAAVERHGFSANRAEPIGVNLMAPHRSLVSPAARGYRHQSRPCAGSLFIRT